VPPCFPHQNQGTVLWVSGPAPPGLRLRGFHPLWRAVPGHFGFSWEGAAGPRNPTFPLTLRQGVRFGLFPFRSPLLRESRLVSLPPPTRMFPFGGFPLPAGSAPPRTSSAGQEVPFRHPGIYGCMRLPRAYRSLPRPSSAPKPSHPPGGVACRVYSGPRLTGVQPMRGGHRERLPV